LRRPIRLHANLFDEKTAIDPIRTLRRLSEVATGTLALVVNNHSSDLRPARPPIAKAHAGEIKLALRVGSRTSDHGVLTRAGHLQKIPIKDAAGAVSNLVGGLFMRLSFMCMCSSLHRTRWHHWSHERQAPCAYGQGRNLIEHGVSCLEAYIASACWRRRDEPELVGVIARRRRGRSLRQNWRRWRGHGAPMLAAHPKVTAKRIAASGPMCARSSQIARL